MGTISLNQMAGGLEKNIVLLANHLVMRGHRVSLVTFDQPGAISFYEIHPGINWHKVGRTRPHTKIGFRDRLELICRIRDVFKATNRPVVICFHHGILPRFYLASLFMGLHFICSERDSLTLYQHIRQAKWSVGFLMLVLTDIITVQFPSYVKDYPWWLKNRINVIPNPVQAVQQPATPEQVSSNGRFRLINVGRLCAQKNQRLLIDAFAKICAKHLDWDLHLIGDGEIYDQLRAHIRTLGLSGRIFLEGRQRDVSSFLSNANLFCMPSQWEGFPNALAEAMAHGLPCIGLKQCAGVRDLIANGTSGLLVDEADLDSALDKMMGSPDARRSMGEASKRLISEYCPELVYQSWDELLDKIDL